MALAYRLFVAGLVGMASVWFAGSRVAVEAATTDVDQPYDPEITSSIRPLPGGVLNVIAELEMKFMPAADGEAGHVNVTLTPQNRALLAHEARQAAEDAFLEALNEPGLGETLTRVRIVVYLHPAPRPQSDRKAYVFSSENGVSWRIEASETFLRVE